MKINHTLAAALLQGIASGTLRYPRNATSGNRLHTERARPGGTEEAERIAAAQARRERRAAKRAKSCIR